MGLSLKSITRGVACQKLKYKKVLTCDRETTHHINTITAAQHFPEVSFPSSAISSTFFRVIMKKEKQRYNKSSARYAKPVNCGARIPSASFIT